GEKFLQKGSPASVFMPEAKLLVPQAKILQPGAKMLVPEVKFSFIDPGYKRKTHI
ncbi:hypothetical protein L195_g058208, partial [Trifolium pratense]